MIYNKRIGDLIMIQNELGARIRELRKAKGYSQETFARKSGIDRTYIASVEAGKRNISIDNIKKIADALNVTLNDLFDFTKPIHNTILLNVNGISFLLETSAELTPEIKEEIELIAKFAFDEEESTLLDVAKTDNLADLYELSPYDIAGLLKQKIEKDLKINISFKAIDGEMKITY